MRASRDGSIGGLLGRFEVDSVADVLWCGPLYALLAVVVVVFCRLLPVEDNAPDPSLRRLRVLSLSWCCWEADA